MQIAFIVPHASGILKANTANCVILLDKKLREREGKRARERERKKEREKDRQTNKQTDRQTDRQT